MHINPQIRYSLHTPHRLLWHWRVLAGATLVFLLVLMLISGWSWTSLMYLLFWVAMDVAFFRILKATRYWYYDAVKQAFMCGRIGLWRGWQTERECPVGAFRGVAVECVENDVGTLQYAQIVLTGEKEGGEVVLARLTPGSKDVMHQHRLRQEAVLLADKITAQTQLPGLGLQEKRLGNVRPAAPETLRMAQPRIMSLLELLFAALFAAFLLACALGMLVLAGLTGWQWSVQPEGLMAWQWAVLGVMVFVLGVPAAYLAVRGYLAQYALWRRRKRFAAKSWAQPAALPVREVPVNPEAGIVLQPFPRWVWHAGLMLLLLLIGVAFGLGWLSKLSLLLAPDMAWRERVLWLLGGACLLVWVMWLSRWLYRLWRGQRRLRYQAAAGQLLLERWTLRGWAEYYRYPLADFIGLYRQWSSDGLEFWLAGQAGGQDVLIGRYLLLSGDAMRDTEVLAAAVSRMTGLPLLEKQP